MDKKIIVRLSLAVFFIFLFIIANLIFTQKSNSNKSKKVGNRIYWTWKNIRKNKLIYEPKIEYELIVSDHVTTYVEGATHYPNFNWSSAVLPSGKVFFWDYNKKIIQEIIDNSIVRLIDCETLPEFAEITGGWNETRMYADSKNLILCIEEYGTYFYSMEDLSLLYKSDLEMPLSMGYPLFFDGECFFSDYSRDNILKMVDIKTGDTKTLEFKSQDGNEELKNFFHIDDSVVKKLNELKNTCRIVSGNFIISQALGKNPNGYETTFYSESLKEIALTISSEKKEIIETIFSEIQINDYLGTDKDELLYFDGYLIIGGKGGSEDRTIIVFDRKFDLIALVDIPEDLPRLHVMENGNLKAAVLYYDYSWCVDADIKERGVSITTVKKTWFPKK